MDCFLVYLFDPFFFCSVVDHFFPLSGLFLYHYKPYWLYFVAFIIIIGGLITYFWHSTPEEQGILEPKPPSYLETQSSETTQEHAAEVDQKV